MDDHLAAILANVPKQRLITLTSIVNETEYMDYLEQLVWEATPVLVEHHMSTLVTMSMVVAFVQLFFVFTGIVGNLVKWDNVFLYLANSYAHP
jgi:hypothetical protein